MDRSALKKYAPQARKDFIAAITDRAGHYGLTKTGIEPVKIDGNTALIGGRPFDRSVAIRRMGLERRIEHEGFDQVMEAIAYTWFNRFVAIRYMELHGYLDHGYRVLSHPEGKPIPEIVEHAEHITLPGLNHDKVIELKLAGDREGDLYRMLLVAQCNALNKAMPFLFERIDDETELLLPENLLQSDSLIRKLVTDIPEVNWQEIEVIGWIYQFYISEKKDQVIGKVVKTEDIPAATQLFTPNWIVKYLVQNSIGRRWLATYPESPLRRQMEYYIEPAEQTPEVQNTLKAITPESLNPEEMTLLDPACGSGHILVEAYDLFKAIYQERGYRAKDIPRLILDNNLFGLEIDERAAQLTSFALIMKARADDRRILDCGIRINIRCIQSSDGIMAEEVYEALTGVDVVDKSGLPPAEEFDFAEEQSAPLLAYLRHGASASSGPQSPHPNAFSLSDIRTLLTLFKGDDAKTFGSLIRIPERLENKLPQIIEITNALAHGDDLNRKTVAERFLPVAEQARILGRTFDIVVTNPPYMGSGYFLPTLKKYVNEKHSDAKSDLYACFMQRNSLFAKTGAFVAMITIPNWMFLSSFDAVRRNVLKNQTIDSFVHNGRGVFGSDFGSCSFVLRNLRINSFRGVYRRLFERQGSVSSNEELIQRFGMAPEYTPVNENFEKIPGSPIAYWAGDNVYRAFENGTRLGAVGKPRLGMATGNNDLYVRRWYEVSVNRIGFECSTRTQALRSQKKWFPYKKGGEYRRWYGNNEYLVNWENDGYLLQTTLHPSGRVWAHNFNLDYIFRSCIEWSRVSSTFFGVRYCDKGFLFDTNGSAAFLEEGHLKVVLGFLCSKLIGTFTSILNPSLVFQAGDVADLPLLPDHFLKMTGRVEPIVDECIHIARTDWDSFETSWDFQRHPFLSDQRNSVSRLEASNHDWELRCERARTRMIELEHMNNTIHISEYGCDHDLTPEVEGSEITLASPNRLRDICSFISFAIGCMMGRYSLDETGLIFAHSGNERFDASRYKTFAADSDGIIPLTDYDWFEDDATNRFVEFIGVAWSKEYVEENLEFVAKNLGQKRGEQSRDTIRGYFTLGFYKDHLQTYRRRPIYWLYSSGKQRAFQCLVYLHRYNEGTLSRMRTEYVIPLQGKMAARIDHLENDIAAAASTSHRNKLQKERDTLRKQLEELRQYDEKLRHYADQRITLDLDDGVKVNYGKFGDLLAEVKAVTGGPAEEE